LACLIRQPASCLLMLPWFARFMIAKVQVRSIPGRPMHLGA
jgi:hypothetical protein